MTLTGIETFEWRRIIRRCRLGRSAKLVAAVMADYANPDGTRVRPGNERLVLVAELSDKTVRTALDRLREVGLIERVFEGSKMGRRGLADEYRLTVPDDLIERVEMLDPNEKPVDNSSNTGNGDRCSNGSADPAETGTPVTDARTPVTDAKNTGNGYRPPNQAPKHTPTNKHDRPPSRLAQLESRSRGSPPVDKPESSRSAA